MELTTEQKFRLETYTRETHSMPANELRSHLVELIRQSMLKDNHIKTMIGRSMGFKPTA